MIDMRCFTSCDTSVVCFARASPAAFTSYAGRNTDAVNLVTTVRCIFTCPLCWDCSWLRCRLSCWTDSGFGCWSMSWNQCWTCSWGHSRRGCWRRGENARMVHMRCIESEYTGIALSAATYPFFLCLLVNWLLFSSQVSHMVQFLRNLVHV